MKVDEVKIIMGAKTGEKDSPKLEHGGYRIINNLFGRQRDFIVIGLCGKTGSGVSVTADILNKEFDALNLNPEASTESSDYERHEYRMLYNYAKRNWDSFYLVKTRALITARVLAKPADKFAEFLYGLIFADSPRKEEEYKKILNKVSTELYEKEMEFEINKQFKVCANAASSDGISLSDFFDIDKNPIDEYEWIRLNADAHCENGKIVSFKNTDRSNVYKVNLSTNPDDEDTVKIILKDESKGIIGIKNKDLYKLFRYYQSSRESKKGNINPVYYWILEEYIYSNLPDFINGFWKEMRNGIDGFEKKETVALQLLGNNLRISDEPFDKVDQNNYYPLKENAYVTIARDINHAIKILRAYMTKKGELANREKGQAGLNSHKVHVRALAVIDSIKNPFESMYLKQRYSNYYLMAVYTDEKQRKDRLLNNKKFAVADIKAIDKVEQLKQFTTEYQSYTKELEEGMLNESSLKEKYSSEILPTLFKRVKEQELEQILPFIIQNVSSCLESADIFINNKKDNSAYLNLKKTLVRYICLMMYPGLVLPTRLEHCMQVAYVGKANSGCISRQVGAVVTDNEYQVLSLGWNQQPQEQLPCLYRDICELHAHYDPEGYSDYENSDDGDNSFQKQIEPLAVEYGHSDSILRDCGRNACYCFKDLYNHITKEKNQVHTRALHAEETAFLNLTGDNKTRARGGYLFTTSSPCVLCAKKARYLNVSKIYYVDPYPDISYDHVLRVGPKESRPDFILFTGAIGTAYTRLYTPLLSIKDERELWLGHKIGESAASENTHAENSAKTETEKTEDNKGEHHT